MKRLLFAGVLLSLSAQGAEPPLPFIQGKGWKNPGGDPYTGSPERAIRSMNFPLDVEREFIRRVGENQPDGIVFLSSHGIVSPEGILYSPFFDMTRREGLALNQRIAFGEKRVEVADRYTFRGYTLIRPNVCNNWTRLYPAGFPFAHPPLESDLPATALLPPGGDYSGPGFWQGFLPVGGGTALPFSPGVFPHVPLFPQGPGHLPPHGPFSPIPSPGPLYLILAFLLFSLSRRAWK